MGELSRWSRSRRRRTGGGREQCTIEDEKKRTRNSKQCGEGRTRWGKLCWQGWGGGRSDGAVAQFDSR